MAEYGAPKAPWSYEVIQDGEDKIVRITLEGYTRAPSIEDDPVAMAKTADILMEVPNVTRIIFYQKRDYEYDYSQVQLVAEISRLFNRLAKEKDKFSLESMKFGMNFTQDMNERYNDLQHFIFQKLKSDPLGSYVELRRLIRRERLKFQKSVDAFYQQGQQRYLNLLLYLLDSLEKTKLVTISKPYLEGHVIGNRDIYRKIFRPIIKPDFMFTKLMASYPTDGIEIGSFKIANDTEVTVFKFKDSVQYLYHIMPPEFRLDEDQYEVLDLARRIMAEHKPEKEEFVNPERMRQVFSNVGQDLIEELAGYKNLRFSPEEMDMLTEILVRYTIGFGLIEVLLQDDEMQDININPPYGQNPMYIVHGEFGDCKTNIIPTTAEADSWASKLRLISGRPLDEANPLLDTELELPGASIRTSTVGPPLSAAGLGFSFRKHRDKPWTLPLFIKNKMISALAAGLLSFLVDGTRTFFVCGTRGSGKTSLLSSLLIEVMRRYRIVTVEDTMELPFNQMRRLGFNIIPLKVSGIMAEGRDTGEFDASMGIRSTLRLGDSSLIVGEVRSKEAVALFEAMRVGAGANLVAGTFHADNPYGVYDRVVNALGIPNTSFKALDLCVIANPIKSPDGLHKFRRVTQITEVRKFWEHDPQAEGGFVDLMKYDSETDMLVVSDALKNGESDVIKSIAANIPDFAGDWDAVWENIQLRAKIKETIVKYSEKNNDPDMLEAPFVIK
ncbi:MAG: type II/IV secretion system ATPase subunit, partial [Nanoarchaeota archaeon]|nr:type II/IV secretion system ATPase subunit [Nanoarchaeota archaeon]